MEHEHIYGNMDQARLDLLSFSMMHANEDRPMYLVVSEGSEGYKIRRAPAGSINAIALNGKIFIPLGGR